MAVNEKQIKLIALKLDIIEEEKCRLFSAVEAYISPVKKLGQSFVDCQNDGDWSFTDVSQTIESALSILTKEVDGFRRLPNEKICDPMGPAVDRMEILEREIKTYSSKTDSLTSSILSLLEELSNLKKQLAAISVMKEARDGLVSQAKQDDRIKELEATVKIYFEVTSKHSNELTKELSTSLVKNGLPLNTFEAKLNDLETQEKTVEIRTRDLETRLNVLEEGHSKLDSEINIIESRFMANDSRLKEFGKRLSNSQELIRTVICDKDKGKLAMLEQLQETINNLEIIRHECNKRTEKNYAEITDLLFRVKVIEEREGDQMDSDPGVIHHLKHGVIEEYAPSKPLQDKIKESSCQGPQLAMLMKVGARVRRGPDWSFGDVDGPVPGFGTVISTERQQYGSVCVKWDNGHKDFYHMGFNDLYQLQLADTI